MANQNQKKKLLCLMQILMECTDEKHIMSAADLCAELQKYDVTAERKSIYNDIAVLQEFGLDIIQQKGSRPGYYLASREFELAELKLLVDAVQASKFITSKKSAELIKKLDSLNLNEYKEKFGVSLGDDFPNALKKCVQYCVLFVQYLA